MMGRILPGWMLRVLFELPSGMVRGGFNSLIGNRFLVILLFCSVTVN